MAALGKTLIVFGLILTALGAVFLGAEKLGLGHLPGDLSFKGKNFTFHFPIATSIIVSIVLTILLNLWLGRGR